MKGKQRGLCAIAVGVLFVGLFAIGVPVSTLLLGALVFACPLMMLFMHGGGHGGHSHNASDRPADASESAPPTHDHESIGRR